MNERASRKIPVTERQFLWVQDDDKGEVTLHVGPTMVSPTAADRVVVDDGLGGFREDPTGKPQMMVEVSDIQYAVLFNPLLEPDGGPNGKFKQGRNESRPLKNGTRSMIPGPCSFWLRPGQRVEVRDAHELASDQYLVVKVYGEVDRTAPFYDLTARSARITRATAENVGGDKKDSTRLADLEPSELQRGQLIVIRGLDTQLYMPPTGVDVVPDTSVDPSGLGLSAEAARTLLNQLSSEVSEPKPEALLPATEEEYPNIPEAQKQVMRRGLAEADTVDQAARSRQKKLMPPPMAVQSAMAPPPAPPPPSPAPAPSLSEFLAVPEVRRALERQARQARLIRRAVVLGEKEYCVIIDADGKREIKFGPARVFPGPYDQFQVKGSRNRIYDAYELLPQRALWLRIISPISRAELAAKLPKGVTLDQEHYTPGDELLLTGVSTFFFPFNEIEVLSPESGEAIVGNDHSRVFIEAIGIDQKSGIYVRDLSTGEARLVRGKLSYLVDPRKEVQITRTVPADDWNLWIAAMEPHKRTSVPVTTPWAVSITVPHNTAVLVTSADGQRVAEGPCVTLLGYEERLTPLSLSTSTPKTDERLLRTCFLRSTGNRVSDEISVETADFVRISIRVSYSVTFLPELRQRWFNHENYIQVLCEHLRSLVRSRCRTMTLSALWPQLPNLIRDTILGERTAEGRKGRILNENGLIVSEVEILLSKIEDAEIGDLMRKVQTQSVTLQIGDRQAQEALASARLRSEVEKEQKDLEMSGHERSAAVRELVRRLTHGDVMGRVKDEEAVAMERSSLAQQREDLVQKAELERQKEKRETELLLVQRDASVRSEAQRALQSADAEFKERLHELEVKLIQAQSAASVAEKEAVQRGLIEALTALGDKVLLSEAAANMNLVSLLKGKDVASLLSEVFGGTKVMPTLAAMVEKFGTQPPPKS
ncbi:MAG: hypothetical protein DIJKHBIC_02195 [Thermoanaerobaculia bacterium]|nr:hypothetical protein [Thermoanaerobaculia bacterium]